MAKKYITTEKLPIKMWLDELEDGALEQAKNLANLPFAFKHIAIMPDSHQGYGMPIGSVLATKKVIVPHAVGVDIGCGMCCMRVGVHELSTEQTKMVVRNIKASVPVGKNQNSRPHPKCNLPILYQGLNIVESNIDKACWQLGTLGGGNHFIEIQKGSDGFIWVMIHSGSRNLGYRVANFYNSKAKEMNEKYYSSTPSDLSFLPIDSELGKEYFKEMNYCIEYAKANRLEMMNAVRYAFRDVFGSDVPFGEVFDESHNLATWENHFGENVLVHRKGATIAREGMVGMIPGSQGSKSYITSGLGNPESFNSCSHGAGRKMSRKRAKKELNLEEEIKHMDSLGVIHDMDSLDKLDESVSAYKDIDIVMENQKDLVKILIELKPIAVIKG